MIYTNVLWIIFFYLVLDIYLFVATAKGVTGGVGRHRLTVRVYVIQRCAGATRSVTSFNGVLVEQEM